MRSIPLLLALLMGEVSCTNRPEPEPADVRSGVNLESRVVEAVDRFHDAIVSHDSTRAASILGPNVRILEGGEVETKEQYLAHHFHSDAAFLGAMTRSPVDRAVSVSGDVAWVVSSSRLTGSYRDRDIDITSLETLVLQRSGVEWKVVSVHWSSR